MKRILKTDNFLILLGFLCIIGFIIRSGADYLKIRFGIDSAPFWEFLLIRAAEFLLPCIICLGAGAYLKIRQRSK